MSRYRILFSSPGRRVELIKIFRKEFGDSVMLFGASNDPSSPSFFFLDRIFTVPKDISRDDHAERLLEICRKNAVDLLIPLVDPELLVISRYRSHFEKSGTLALISDYESVQISADKLKTFQFFKNIGIPTPETWELKDFEDLEPRYPVLLKPRYGSAGKGIYKVHNIDQLRALSTPEHIVQEIATGYEITMDIFGTGDGRCIQAVPRLRLKVRGGEVERGITIWDPRLLEYARIISKHFKPFGAINVQLFRDNKKHMFTEINARFGGGYPLSYRAGANFPRLILKMLKREPIEEELGNYKKGIYMLRYDEAVYTERLKNMESE